MSGLCAPPRYRPLTTPSPVPPPSSNGLPLSPINTSNAQDEAFLLDISASQSPSGTPKTPQSRLSTLTPLSSPSHGDPTTDDTPECLPSVFAFNPVTGLEIEVPSRNIPSSTVHKPVNFKNHLLVEPHTYVFGNDQTVSHSLTYTRLHSPYLTIMAHIFHPKFITYYSVDQNIRLVSYKNIDGEPLKAGHERIISVGDVVAVDIVESEDLAQHGTWLVVVLEIMTGCNEKGVKVKGERNIFFLGAYIIDLKWMDAAISKDVIKKRTGDKFVAQSTLSVLSQLTSSRINAVAAHIKATNGCSSFMSTERALLPATAIRSEC